MIVGELKPLAEIMELLDDAKKVLVVGCGTCVTVCFAGGEKEVGILASALRMRSKLEGHPMEVDEVTVQRQCEWEYIDPLGQQLDECDVVLSMACGIGVQAMNERFSDMVTLPGLNTTFLGLPEEHGVWEQRLVGIATDRDIRLASNSPVILREKWHDEYLLDNVKIEACMTPDPITVTPDTSVEKAASLMRDQKVGGLPVMQGDRLVGIVTETDVLN